MPRLSARDRKTIVDVASKYGARNLRLFGSVARGEATALSDIDLLVDLDHGRSLLDQVGLKQDLEHLLHRRVDIVIEGGLNPYLEERILAQAVPL